ncbi:alpha/beta fold hydrolase [Roseivirga sp.]|uniref:alpha/beta fold hydrolase n=1 Tax=Roseivirga sp. TaxID=1964215 RepID=UPI003B8B569B
MKKPLILLHGALGSENSLAPLKDILAESFDLFSFNFSGHGRTSFSEAGFGIEVFAEELEVFIKANNLIKPNIFGYSMGGYVALYLAATQPNTIGKIATLGTKFNWNPESAELETSRMNPEVMKEKIPSYTNFLEKNHGDKWEELVQQTAAMMLELGDAPLLNHDTLNQVNSAVLVLRGGADHMVGQEESKKAVLAIENGLYGEFLETKHPIEKVDPKVLAASLKRFF